MLFRLVVANDAAWTYQALADELGLTASEIYAGVERAAIAQLVRKDATAKASVVREALKMFVLHGARYSFPATRGELTRGVPTGYAAPPLSEQIAAGDEPLPVWPFKDGTVRGAALYPLYPSVPQAALRNRVLYELLSLFDAVRGGSMRERALAFEILAQRLG